MEDKIICPCYTCNSAHLLLSSYRFFAGVIAYIVIGMIVNYKVKGARGVEMIPNWSFWKDMPFLLKVYIMAHLTCVRKYQSEINT